MKSAKSIFSLSKKKKIQIHFFPIFCALKLKFVSNLGALYFFYFLAVSNEKFYFIFLNFKEVLIRDNLIVKFKNKNKFRLRFNCKSRCKRVSLIPLALKGQLQNLNRVASENCQKQI